MKKIKLIIIFSLLLGLFAFTNLCADDVNGEVYDINGKMILKIWGTHPQRGYAYGYLLHNEIIDVMKNYLLQQVFMNNAAAYENARAYFETYFEVEEKYITETYGMINGIQDGGGSLYSSVLQRNLDNVDILLSNTIVDLSVRFSILGDIMHCSSLSSWDESTIQDPELAGESIITRHLDWMPSQTLLDNQLIIVNLPAEAEEQNWISFAFAGFMGSLSGINESGVTAFMDVGNIGTHPNLETMHPIFLSIRNGIESADYNENGQCNPADVADAIADKLHLSGSITHSICSTEKDSFALVTESNNANGVAIRTVADNTEVPGDNLVATNHFRTLYPPVFCDRYNNIVDSLDVSTEISSARSWDLLCGAAGTYGNLQTIQFIPVNGQILWATSPDPANPAYTQIPTEFNLEELFELNNITSPNGENRLQIFSYPNPFSYETEIFYQLPRGVRDCEIEIYNVKGQKVKSLECSNRVNATEPHYEYSATWNGKNEQGKQVAQGVYFYKVETAEETMVKKMVLVR